MKFTPEKYQIYYFVDSDGKVRKDSWFSNTFEVRRAEFYNCFETKEEAEEVASKIRKLLKEHQEGKEQEDLYTKLPEWCVYEAWGWSLIKGYFKIKSIEKHTLDGTRINFVSPEGTFGWFTPYKINTECLPARKEYYLQSILGKSITLSNGDTVTIIGYNQSEQCVHLSDLTKHSIEHLLTCENVKFNFDLKTPTLKHLVREEWVE